MAPAARTAHATTQSLGLSLMAVSLIAVVVVTMVLFGGEDIGFFGMVALVVGVVTLVVWRFDVTWARVLGIVATLGAGFVTFFLALGILQVFSPLEFVVGLAFTLGVLLSLIGGTLALVSARKRVPGPTAAETRLRRGVLGLIGLLAVVSITGFYLTRSTVAEADSAGATAVEMVDFAFDPAVTSMASGGKLLVSNSDAFAHDITIEDLDIYVHLGPGSESVVDLSDVAPGTYDYFCSLHSDGTEGMTGTVTIGA